ncbi:uncharacterized protein LOC108092895 [Drosophila ficusphila]|uniref:uncharacterized protein LOC108092895 n=1 Tax=Drosophila ficusphila TaxID=30025 RepID=UPI0007E64B8F|nr:uncharacterized protein LOC108092895 [Drosophila ficusphila]
MQQDKEQEEVHEERRWCGIGNHKLRTPYRELGNEHLYKFAKRLNSEIQITSPLCVTCYKSLLRVYNLKNNNARMHRERAEASSVTDVSGNSVGVSTATSAIVRNIISPPTSTSDDEPISNLSLNAVNGTRLPHIQPIPKRRPTVHLNKEAMDIYLQGTTGG